MFEEELAFARELAEEAGRIALSYFRGEFEVRMKPDATPVTEADLAVEAMIRERLADRFPADAVLGEEGGGSADAERLWVIDPIDGTKNFAARIQVWATLIALVVDGEPAVGVAHAPALGEHYEAALGAGAALNGEPIHVSSTARIDQAVLSFAGLGSWLGTPYERGFLDLCRSVARTRGFGDFWGHTLVARGSVDAMVEDGLRVWDTAALRIIVEEAGGRVTALDGGPVTDGGGVVTTNGTLHDEVLATLKA